MTVGCYMVQTKAWQFYTFKVFLLAIDSLYSSLNQLFSLLINRLHVFIEFFSFFTISYVKICQRITFLHKFQFPRAIFMPHNICYILLVVVFKQLILPSIPKTFFHSRMMKHQTQRLLLAPDNMADDERIPVQDGHDLHGHQFLQTSCYHPHNPYC